MPAAVPGKDETPPRPPAKPDLYVIARFLDCLWRPAWEVPPAYTKAKLQLAVRLNYDLFRRYLAFLVEKKFVEVRADPRGTEVIVLTAEGRKAHDELVAWLRGVFGDGQL